jgi:hypothetical protein
MDAKVLLETKSRRISIDNLSDIRRREEECLRGFRTKKIKEENA